MKKRIFAVYRDNPQIRWDNICWKNVIVFGVFHAVALFGMWYWLRYGLDTQTKWLLVGYWCVTTFSVTGGVHRYFTHGSYECRRWFRVLLIFLSAGTFQGTLMMWVAYHRAHHAHDGEDGDPHNINLGYWWAHWLWLFFGKDRRINYRFIPELKQDRIAIFQRDHYTPIAVFSGVVLPTMICGLWGDWLGGFLVVGFTRIVFQLHITWSINSAAHRYGSRPFSKRTTAVQNWVLAILSLGEGKHNGHHAFPKDCGSVGRWWEPDLTLYLLYLLRSVGVVWNMKFAEKDDVEQALKGASV